MREFFSKIILWAITCTTSTPTEKDKILQNLLNQHKLATEGKQPCNIDNPCGNTCEMVRTSNGTGPVIRKPLCITKNIIQPSVPSIRLSKLNSTITKASTVMLDGNSLFSIRKRRDVKFESQERFILSFLKNGRRHRNIYHHRDLTIKLNHKSACKKVPNLLFLSLFLINPIVGALSMVIKNHLESQHLFTELSGSLRLNSDNLLLYKHFGSRKYNHHDAFSQCQKIGLSLPVPTDESIFAILGTFTHLSGDFHLGVSDRNQEGTWRSVYNATETIWMSWAPGEPNNGRTNRIKVENYCKIRCDGFTNDISARVELSTLCVRVVKVSESEISQSRFTPNSYLESIELGECPPFPKGTMLPATILTPYNSCRDRYLKLVPRHSDKKSGQNCVFYRKPLSAYNCRNYESLTLDADLAYARQTANRDYFMTKNYTATKNPEFLKIYTDLTISLNQTYPCILSLTSLFPCLASYTEAASDFIKLLPDGHRGDEVLILHGLDTCIECVTGPLSLFRLKLIEAMFDKIANLTELEESAEIIRDLPKKLFSDTLIDGEIERVQIFSFLEMAKRYLSDHTFSEEYARFKVQKAARTALLGHLGERVKITNIINQQDALQASRTYKNISVTKLAIIFSSSSTTNKGSS